MQPPVSIPNRHLYLHRPLAAANIQSWDGIWFDPAHQLFIILVGKVVYRWSLREKYTSSPLLADSHIHNPPRAGRADLENTAAVDVSQIYEDEFFAQPVNSSNPSDPINPKCLLIKLSLDLRLLACQVSMTCVMIFDIESRTKWVINFKPNEDKKILPAGVVWSEHGGNSQDLIIVTNKGLELHKVSSIRSQCKLSRSITQNIAYFWYDPCHRMMLIASTIKNGSILGCSLSGIFFRYDNVNSIKLELPPPDRSPNFELWVQKDSIGLVSIHNSIYCHCLNRVTDAGNTNLLLYCITKSSVERTHILSLNIATKSVRTSVLDNLLLCHCLDIQKTVFFDISLPASKVVTLEDDSQAHVWQPISIPSAVVFNSIETSSNNNTEIEDAKYNSSLPPSSILSTSSQTNGTPSRRFSEHSLNHLPATSNNAQSSNSNVDWDDAVGIGVSDIVPVGLKSGHQKAKNVGSNHNPSIISESVSSLASSIVEKKTTDYKVAADMYSNTKWIFLPPCWVWDASSHHVWRLAIDLKSVSDSIYEVKRQTLFLSRRGLPLITPKLAYFTAYDCDEGPEAKNLLIRMMKNSLEAKMSLNMLDNLFQTFLKSYINENARLSKLQQGNNSLDRLNNNSQKDNNNSMTLEQQLLAVQKQQLQKTASISAPQKRFSFAFGRLGSSSNLSAAPSSQNSEGSSNSSFGMNAETTTTQIKFCIQEPLEPSYSVNPYLPSIASVSFNIRQDNGHSKAARNNVEDLPRSRTLSDVNVVKSREYTHPKVPLTTRRDEAGSLIVSQTELLCHLWVPLILRKDCDLNYISWALSLYISNLRSEHILVHPALLIMLLHVLLSQRKFLQIARLLQFHFFPDSTEVAMASLEFADIVIDMELSGKKTVFCFQRQSVISAIRAMQQVGLDMLWRLQERASVVRWLLSHGKLTAAMSLCMKRRGGNFRTGLTPASVSSIEFFSAAIVAINNYIAKNEKFLCIDKVNFEIDAVDVKSPNSTISEDDFTVIRDDNSISSANYLVGPVQFDEQTCFIENTLHCVYNFILEWERSVVDVLTSGKSRLASQVSFPTLGLSPEKTAFFKQLFGFQT